MTLEAAVDRLSDTALRVKRERDDLLLAVTRLLNGYDAERAAIDCDPDPGCVECTHGTTPHDRDTGPCARHFAEATVRSLLDRSA